MARITTVTFIVLMIFTTVAFGGQQPAARQITLSIRSLTITADQLSYHSDSGVVKASGNVTVEVKGRFKLSTTDTVDIKIDRTLNTVDGRVSGRASATIAASDGSLLTTSPEGRGTYSFRYEF